ncbi:ORFL137W.iORF1 [Human betaherpesvirus 5]|nr:ORFL137W.iORF1 [Human betaherpesvirus 5]QHX40464.1 ORFL137W.iORF1 [Human betaherpesvirus 5]
MARAPASSTYGRSAGRRGGRLIPGKSSTPRQPLPSLRIPDAQPRHLGGRRTAQLLCGRNHVRRHAIHRTHQCDQHH